MPYAATHLMLDVGDVSHLAASAWPDQSGHPPLIGPNTTEEASIVGGDVAKCLATAIISWKLHYEGRAVFGVFNGRIITGKGGSGISRSYRPALPNLGTSIAKKCGAIL